MSTWLQNSCWSAAPYSLHTKQLATQRTCPLGAYIYDGIKMLSAFPLPCPLGDIYLALFSFFFLLPSKESSDFSAWLLCSVIENKKEVGRKGTQKDEQKDEDWSNFTEKKIEIKERELPQFIKAVDGRETGKTLRDFEKLCIYPLHGIWESPVYVLLASAMHLNAYISLGLFYVCRLGWEGWWCGVSQTWGQTLEEHCCLWKLLCDSHIKTVSYWARDLWEKIPREDNSTPRCFLLIASWMFTCYHSRFYSLFLGSVLFEIYLRRNSE